MNNPVIAWRKNKALHKDIGRVGKIVVWTKIFVAPAGFQQQVPYVVAIVSFGNDERKTLQVVDYDEGQLKVGQKVICVVRRIGFPQKEDIISYGIKVKPV